jgi:hypothetical protein
MRVSFGLLAAACVCLAAPAASAAVYTFDFTGSGGNLGKTAAFADTTNSKSLTAHAINTEMSSFPFNPTLNQTGDGIGVQLLSTLDIGEIDNGGADEGIVFDLGGLGVAQSAGLNNLGIAFSIFGHTVSATEGYEIYGSNDASILGCGTTGRACLTSLATILASGSDVFDITVNFSDPALYRYIIATIPGGAGIIGDLGADSYRVAGLTVDLAEVAAVPLPPALPLLISALAGTGFLARRRPA